MAELRHQSGVRVHVEPYGPDETVVARAATELRQHRVVREHLKDGYRLMSFRLVDEDAKEIEGVPEPSKRFVATLFEYKNNRAIVVSGSLDDLDSAIAMPTGSGGPLAPGEFAAAADRVLADRALRQAITEDRPFDQAAAEPVPREAETVDSFESPKPTVYQPMPPLVDLELADGTTQRVIPVGLYTPARDIAHRVVGVNLHTNQLVSHIPGLEFSPRNDCGAPVGDQSCESGTAGQIRLKVLYAGTTVWDMVVVRPAATGAPLSTNGTGLELRYVDYRGKRVLYRAHVPILNVRYAAGGCAPSYRDWETSEACFQAAGTDIIPGYRLCSSPATTIVDTGVDGGNFRGVAIYVDGLEVVLVSVLMAGWYRYESQWRFHVDGSIRPRFGFAATSSPCTCFDHAHHAYWRLDFDIETPSNNVVREYNNPPIIPGTNLHTKHFEIRRLRSAAHNRHWEVSNHASGAGYRLIPGPHDGFADAFGVGDLWVLRYHGNEIDDGQGFTTTPALAMEHIDRFINGESVYREDVVLWYVGHFTHGVGAAVGGHRVGPDLEPFNWP